MRHIWITRGGGKGAEVPMLDTQNVRKFGSYFFIWFVFVKLYIFNIFLYGILG